MEFTQKLLKEWAGEAVYRDAKLLYERGAVLEVRFDAPILEGTLSFGNRSLTTRANVSPDGTCESLCPCRDATERGIVCSHVIALGMVMAKRYETEVARRDVKVKEESVKAARVAVVDESAYLQRTVVGASSLDRMALVLALSAGWNGSALVREVTLRALLDQGRARHSIRRPPATPVKLSPDDDALMYVLEDILEGPVPEQFTINAQDFANVLKVREGRTVELPDGAEAQVNGTPLKSNLQVDLHRTTGELILVLHTELPFLGQGERPVYIVQGKRGWVFGAGHFWPLDHVLPGPFQELYNGPVRIARDAVLRFFEIELPLIEKEMAVATDLQRDLFAVEPETPRFRLEIRGSPASLAATLVADYQGVRMVAAKPDPAGHFAHPDPEDLFRFTVRNPSAEKAGLERIGRAGFRGVVGDDLTPIVGTRDVMNFLGREWPALRRAGWKLDLQGPVAEFMEQADFIAPVVKIHDRGGNGFDVGFQFEDARGGQWSAQEIQHALRMGDAFLERDAHTCLLDAGAIEAMQDVFDDCASGEGDEPGMFRLPPIYASYVKSSLDALDGIDVEVTPEWLEAARKQNREITLEPVAPHPLLNASLRPYQYDGLNWLRFLERGGYGGVLADEMGLGKTLQTLAWLQLDRVEEAARELPALIVCPTSLVDNWALEAARFTPDLRVLTVTGSDRRQKWAGLHEHDVIITSYALLRRDIEQYAAQPFSVVILDEAQHIKNKATQNALAAKRLQARHRLVLTGTPIENGVSDFWSIMDFLMPGYLGGHEKFRRNYELPISRGEDGAAFAQAKLKRKLSPFLLRRLKRDVATDLPPKIERVAYCPLSGDQQAVYRKLLDASRRRLTQLVNEQGFNRSRMEVLKTLLRLRQVCCHLALLKEEAPPAENPSAKLELFMELLNEAMDGGHRVLVFSQFVSMLTILRQELERRGAAYCYLDGSTQDRMAVVHTFNTNRAIPVFLISLKAGGTGLNLTGADMVIHYDPWWNPAVEAQATDRAYRIGQKRTVYSVKLITKGTIEEKVLAMQERKRAIIDATLENDEQVMDKLSWEDVQELLEL
ncbi:MAG TPA: DEAD/DEAH box helicase [Kiritimatiellia bacterium]|nr:DEAD/DEAH box helicase [Kiritimatiellia bacterium]HMO98411.1 DEAD/DEAH box helicase [Kiritimatiellia bacterium]HMP96464.1 DEAD/DEAH box helicase [Kiritimatiellia bacterium]